MPFARCHTTWHPHTNEQPANPLPQSYPSASCPPPKGVAPLLTFPLGHATFQAELRRFLRECISKHREQTIPFHPPSTKVVFRRHPQIQQVLCNWRNTHHRWVPDQPPPCTCQHLRTTHYPRLFHGHIAAPLSELLPDQRCLKFSGKSTLFPKVGQLHTQQIQAIQRWHKRNQLPTPSTDDSTLNTFINHQIQQHLAAAHHHINIHIIKQIQQQLPAGIIHCEDHRPNHLLWFCPALYHATITNTFTDTNIFTISQAPPLTVHMETQQQLKDMLPNYKKHFGDWGKIPGAYVLPKRKKQFQKGRPIVAFVQPAAKALWQTLSDLLGALCRQACPHSFGDGDATSQLRQLTAFIQQTTNDDETYQLHDQDLAGFFTSVTQDRFLQSFELMYSWYMQRSRQHAPTFTNQHSHHRPEQRTHRGSYKRNPFAQPGTVTIQVRDIPLLIRAVLKLNYFMVGNTLIVQQRGAPMGSPASPALCSMVVSVEEQAWYFTFQHLIHNHKTHQHLQQQHQHPHTLPFFSTRYVDNRVVILPLRAANLPCFRQLLDESFYRQPIQLEYEPANTFLGFAVHLAPPSIRYAAACQSDDVLAPNSASPASTTLSGLQARMITINRVCAPPRHADTAAAQLRRLYVQAGFSATEVESIIARCKWARRGVR